jgi:hypothetical protein
MDKPLEILLAIVIGLAIILAVYLLLPKTKPSTMPGEELSKACLELLKNGCKEREVSVGEKSFEDVCKENGLTLEECKKHCGCEE